MFQTARAKRVLSLRCRPVHVSTYPGSNRYLDAKTLAKAKEIFAVPTFPHKQVLHNWRFFLKAGKAATGPPVGQEFSKIGLKAMDFAKNFNDRTKPLFKDDVELIVRIQVYFDKSYTYRIEPPPTAWFILRAIRRKRGETSSVSLAGSYTAFLTLEMCYEIAKMKGIRNFDRLEADQPIETRVRRVIGQARRMGVALIGVDTTAESPIGKQEGEWGSYPAGDLPNVLSPPTVEEGGGKEEGKKGGSDVGKKPSGKSGDSTPRASNTSSFSSSSAVKSKAPTKSQYEKKCAEFRAIHMAQYLELRQQQLDEAPLYDRIQYMHHYYPPPSLFPPGPTSSSVGKATPPRAIPVGHPHKGGGTGGRRVDGEEKSTPGQHAKGDPSLDGRFSTRILSPLSTEKLEEGLQDARLFHSLWQVSQPKTVYERDMAEREAAKRYLQTRGWFHEMNREEMNVVFGDILGSRGGGVRGKGKTSGTSAGIEGGDDMNGVVEVKDGRRGDHEDGDPSPSFPFSNPFARA